MSKKRSSDFDSPWKKMLEKYFRLWLEFLFPVVAREIDWSEPAIHLDKELLLIQRRSRIGKRIADKLIRVCKRDGKAMLVILHVEIQGGKEKRFEERLFEYYYRIYDRYKIPVLTLAILTDSNNSWRPREYAQEVLGCQLKFKFLMVKLIDFTRRKEILSASQNPIAKVIEAHLAALVSRKNVELKFENKLKLVKNLYTIGDTKDQISDLYDVIDYFISLPTDLECGFIEEMHRYEEKMSMPYINSARRIGRQEGKQEGKQEGIGIGVRKTFLFVLKNACNAEIPSSVLARVEEASEQELEHLRSRKSQLRLPKA